MIIWCTILTDKKSFPVLSRKFTEIKVSQIRLFPQGGPETSALEGGDSPFPYPHRREVFYLIYYCLVYICMELFSYHIYSINRPGRLLNFWTLGVSAFSRWALIRGWALIKFSPFSASVVVYFVTKQ